VESAFSDTILRWFDANARVLPWRLPVPRNDRLSFDRAVRARFPDFTKDHPISIRRDPYTVVVSEFMLQQTQVTAVIPYYERFMARFPTMNDLASALQTDVLKAWEGLGYYRRARFLHAFGMRVSSDYDGIIPPLKKELMALPGIGEYTAGAVLSFAYDQPEPAVDGNIVRIVSRFDAVPHVRGSAKALRTVRKRICELMPTDGRAGDFNEALMDLGAMVCTPSSPQCEHCPLQQMCQAYAADAVGRFPVRPGAEDKPVTSFSYVLLHVHGSVYVQRRPKGLLEGLFEFFSLPEPFGPDNPAGFRESLCRHLRRRGVYDAPESAGIRFIDKRRAVYSHRIWDVFLWEAELSSVIPAVRDGDPEGACWVRAEKLHDLPFPSVLVPWRDAFISRTISKCLV